MLGDRHDRLSVSYIRLGFGVTVDVRVSCGKGELTKEEQRNLVIALADKAMLSLNENAYVRAPLSKIKVR